LITTLIGLELKKTNSRLLIFFNELDVAKGSPRQVIP